MCTPASKLLAEQTELLGQLRAVVEVFDDEQYLAGDDRVPGSTCGRQVRHCLNHYEQWLAGLDEGVIDYGARTREQSVETQRTLALARIDELLTRLAAVQSLPADLQLRLESGTLVKTSAERELDFLSSHTIHHLAVLGILAREQGLPVADDLGVAFSTLAHQRRSA